MIRQPYPTDAQALGIALCDRYKMLFVPKSGSAVATFAGSIFDKFGLIHGSDWPHYSSTFPADAPGVLDKATTFLSDNFYQADPQTQCEILIHEATHRWQALNCLGGPWAWIGKYVADQNFRTEQEAQAYATSHAFRRAQSPTYTLPAPADVLANLRVNYGIAADVATAAEAVAASLLAEIEAGGTVSEPVRVAINLLGGNVQLDKAPQLIMVYDKTSGLPADGYALPDVVRAWERQLNEQLAPAWGLGQFHIEIGNKADMLPPGAWALNLVDREDQPDALGHHDDQAFPFSIVGVGTAGADGVPWPSVGSHELCEMALDPDCQQARAVGSEQWALEACDPVEGDAGQYRIDSIPLEDFVLPGYFDAGSAGPWDFRGALKAPLTLLPGGYQSVQLPSGAWVQRNGDRVRAIKVVPHPLSRRGRRIGRG